MVNFRLSFGKTVLKCRPCGVSIHHDCQAWYVKTCLPKGQGKLSGKQGYIADYVGTEAPMIPALIIHCINEVCQFEWWLIFFTFRLKLIIEIFHFRSNREVCPKKAFIVFRAQIKKLNHLSRDFCNGKPYKIYKALISMSFVDASKTSYEGWKSHWFHIISGYNFQMPFNWLMMLKSNQN